MANATFVIVKTVPLLGAYEQNATLDAIYFADGKSITSENTVHDETDYAP